MSRTSEAEGWSYVYRGYSILYSQYKNGHDLRVDGLRVSVMAVGPRAYTSPALPGRRYRSVTALGEALVRAYFGASPSPEPEPEPDDFELPEAS